MLKRILILLICAPLFGQAQLVVTNTQTPQQLVQNVLLGTGLVATNITFNGQPGTVLNDQIAEFDGTMSNIGLNNGIAMATATATGLVPGAPVGGPLNPFVAGDPDLAAIVTPNSINDAAVLEFDFIPTGDSLSFRFVFGSEEYPNYVCSQFNDVFGFFLSGPGIAGPFTNMATNIALIPGTTVPVSINTVNSGVAGINGMASTCATADPNWVANSIYYVDNSLGTTVELEGFTVAITAQAVVQCGMPYHIKIALADVVDGALDSGVFLEAGSFSSSGQVAANLTPSLTVNDTTMLESCLPVEFTFARVGDTSVVDTIDLTVGGTATPGVDYSPALPAQLIFLPGDTLVTVAFTVPNDADVGPETITITVNQNSTCGGAALQTNYTFYIVDPPPLTVSGGDVSITCGQSVQIGGVASGGFGVYSYSWNTGQQTDSITVSPSVTTDYIISAMDTCGLGPATDTITVTLPVYAPLQLQLTPDTALACLSSANLNLYSTTGGNGVYTYSWTDSLGNVLSNTTSVNVSAGNPTWYYITVNEGCGDSIQDSILVTTAVLPNIDIFLPDTIVALCVGDTVILDADSVTGGNGVYTYQWALNGANIGAGNLVPVAVDTLNNFTVTINDQCGNTSVQPLVVIVRDYPEMTLEVLPSEIICMGESVDLYAWVDGGSGFYTVSWPTILDGNGNPFSDPALTVTPVNELTFYPVTITDACGQTLSDSSLIVAEDIETDIVVTQPGQDDVTLFAASDPPGVSYVWDMGDGTRFRGDAVSHSYLTIDQSFTVELVVTTENGCTDTSLVLIDPPSHVYFPNAFTPDGDGINDFFTPVYHDLDILELIIFDRWGHEVHNSLDRGTVVWDGTVNGDGGATPGVYVYWYRVAGHLLPNYDGFGHVTLVR